MIAFTLKNIPPDLYDRLKRRAAANRRSVNSEILAAIESAVESHAIDPETFLVRARRLREKTSAYEVDDQAFSQAKKSGRP